MKIMSRAAAFILAAAVMLCIAVFPACAQNNDSVVPRNTFTYYANDYQSSLYSPKYTKTENAYLGDEAELFGEYDFNTIFSDIQDAADKTGINVAVFIGGNYRSDGLTRTFAETCVEMLFGTKAETNSLFLYLDFEGHSSSYDYIDAYHDARLYYPNSGFNDRIEEMIDDMYKFLPKSGSTVYTSDVTKAIQAFCSDVRHYYEKGMVWEASYYNEEIGEYRYVFFGNVLSGPLPPYKHFFIFLVIGIIIGILVSISNANSIKKKYKFRETPNASVYTSRNRIKFNNVSDRFINEHTTSYRIQSSSGGGGGHGGGGSHGGGGGHR